MSYLKIIGKRIKDSREALNLSQEQLGNLINYSTSTISKIESGNFRLSIQSLDKLAQVLEKPVYYFLEKKEPCEYKLGAKIKSIENALSKLTSSMNKNIVKARKDSFYLVIWGNIRVGKNEVIKQLGKHFKAKAYFGLEDKNPYQQKFYRNKRRWAFHSESFFIIENFKQQRTIQRDLGPVIHEWSIYENYRVWIKTIYEFGFLTKTEFAFLSNLYNYAKFLFRRPDLVVYLKGDPKRIWNKLPFEEKRCYSKRYLMKLHEKYEDLALNFDLAPVLTIDTDLIDIFDQSGINKVIKKVEGML